ncbi:MAG TPA: DUF2971 domain-containing protein [Allosphingosinicella sp.]|jgi:hypothetical protein
MEQDASILQATSQKWLEDANTSKLADIPAVAYHYTDAAGLWGMLRSGKIWATGARFLNDKEEMRLLVKSSREFLRRRSRDGRSKATGAFYEKLLDSLESTTHFSLFIFSLSSEKDDLSQWRAYAKDGEGFTIGFVGRQIYDLAQQRPADFSFSQVEYDPDRQLSSIEAALQDMEAALAAAVRETPAEEARLCEEASYYMDYLIKARAAVAKHRSFSAEKEWRILFGVAEGDEGAEIKTRVSGRRLVPYVEIDLAAKCGGKLPIRTIGIGPGFSGSDDFEAVRLLCRSAGYDIDIYYADTPYRRI